ncbi:hypothetical protein Tco_0034494, partial [Tanacetum coccineum]
HMVSYRDDDGEENGSGYNKLSPQPLPIRIKELV